MQSALELAKSIRKKLISPQEAILDVQQKIQHLNPELNAVTYTRFPEALQEAKQLKDTGQPFYGVPLLIKGLGQSLKGAPDTMGSYLFAKQISSITDNFVQRLQQLGFIIVGQTNVPEFGFKNITDANLYGPAKNPWNLSFSPGGSSGGAASALAAGMVSLATGSDGGGSIRIPASFSGLIGLKPTRGRVPVGPDEYRSWQGAAINFALTQTVADTAAFLRGTQTLQPEAPFQAPLIPPTDFDNLVGLSKDMTIAYTLDSPVGTPVSVQAKAAVLNAVKFLESEGFHLEAAQPNLDGRALMDSYFVMNDGETAAMFQAFERAQGKTVLRSQVELITWVIYQAGKHTTAADYSLSLGTWDQAAQVMADFMAKYPLYLTPTTARLAPTINAQLQSPLIQKQMHHVESLSPKEQQNLVYDLFYESLKYSPFTQLANLTGQPAISLPTYVDPQKHLPLGIQFMAGKGEELLLLKIAQHFESAGQFQFLNE